MESGVIKTLFTSVEKDEALFPRTKTRAVSDDNGVGLDALLSQINTELDGKAPAGFGLGGNIVKMSGASSLNNAIYNGWYYISDINSENDVMKGVYFGYALVHVTAVDAYHVKQILYPCGTSGCVLSRMKTATEWGEWEIENPPMYLGVEYRTTERWLGMPVYCKAVNVEAFPTNGSSASVQYLDYSPRAVLRFVAHSSYILYPNRVYGKHIDVMDNKIYMESTGEAYDGGSVHVAVWYVKN